MIRYKFMKTPLWSTILQVIIGGAIVFLSGIWLGTLGVSDQDPSALNINSLTQ